MEFEFFIGIDVSKNELDFAVQQGNHFLFHREIANEPGSINAFIKELGKLPGFKLDKAVFCMEHTGIYNNHALSCLYKKKACICLEAATQIRNSLGNIRGKNDKVDAMRIAGYAYDKGDRLRLWEPKREVVQQLAHLAATRLRLITVKKQLKTPLKEHNGFSSGKVARQNLQICSHSLKAIDEDLARADKAIEQLIHADTELCRLFRLVTSVSGIGKVTAVQVIVATKSLPLMSLRISITLKSLPVIAGLPHLPMTPARSSKKPGYRTWPIKRSKHYYTCRPLLPYNITRA